MPARPPTAIETRPKARASHWWGWATSHSKTRGASFCQVDRIIAVVMLVPWIISGSQACKGANPIFKVKPAMITSMARSSLLSEIFQCPVAWAFNTLPQRIIAAPVAWMRRYFMEASTARGW